MQEVKSAVISALLMGVLGVGTYITGIGDIFGLDWRTITNIFAVAVITGVVSYVKSLMTTKEGNFAGIVKIK